MKILEIQNRDGIADEYCSTDCFPWNARGRSDPRPLLLVLINFERLDRVRAKYIIEDIGVAVASSIRDTDVTGWHQNRRR
jgi:hypothetical protein